MKRGYKHAEGEAYLAKYPRLRHWVCQCGACQQQGYVADLPEQIGTGVAAQNIRRYFQPLTLNDQGLCEACAKLQAL